MMAPAEIRKARKRLDMSQETFAKALGVSFATVNRWENGKSLPQHAHSEKLRALVANPVVATSFKGLVDYWTGKLVLAIGSGDFRGEVAVMLQAVMKDAYERGVRGDALIG